MYLSSYLLLNVHQPFLSFHSYFNFRSTKYLVSEGIYNFHNWFDEASWYPLGRIVGGTIYPGKLLCIGFVMCSHLCMIRSDGHRCCGVLGVELFQPHREHQKCLCVACPLVCIQHCHGHLFLCQGGQGLQHWSCCCCIHRHRAWYSLRCISLDSLHLSTAIPIISRPSLSLFSPPIHVHQYFTSPHILMRRQ